MAVQLNFLNCDTDRLGTGINDCIVELNSQPYGYFLVDRSWSFDIDGPDDFDQQYIDDRIQDGTFIPFVNTTNFTDNSEETVFETFDSGVKSRVRSGFPEYGFSFDKSLYFHRAAHSYITFQAYNVIFVLRDSTLVVAETVDGTEITGFAAGYVDAATFQFATGTTVDKTNTAFQLIDPEQFNRRANAITSGASGIDINNINGQIDLTLTLQTPAAAATDLIFSAVIAGNTAIQADFLTATDVRVVGTTGNITGLVYDSGTMLYTLSLDAGVASTEEIFVQVWDAAFLPNPVPAADIAGEIYAGTSNTVTVP